MSEKLIYEVAAEWKRDEPETMIVFMTKGQMKLVTGILEAAYRRGEIWNFQVTEVDIHPFVKLKDWFDANRLRGAKEWGPT